MENLIEELLRRGEDQRSGDDRRHESRKVDRERRSGYERRYAVRERARIIPGVKGIPLFSGLSEDEYEEILNICSRLELGDAETLFRAGDSAGELFIVLDGRLDVVLPNNTVVATVGRNGAVGEMGVFTNSSRSATVVTSGETELIVIVKHELMELLELDLRLCKKVLLNVIADLSKKLFTENARIGELRDGEFDTSCS